MSTRKTIVGTNASLGGPATTATIDSSNNPANSIINNLNVKIQPKDIKRDVEEYEAVKYQGDDDVTVLRQKSRNQSQEVLEGIRQKSRNQSQEVFEEGVQGREYTADDDHDLLVYLINIFHNIIVKDYKSILNIIDTCGLVILDSDSLIGLISRVLGIEESCVKIVIEEETDVGCCGAIKTKYIPLKPISKIKVDCGNGFVDLDLVYNTIYNKIIDTYGISLEKIYETSYLASLLSK